MPGKGEPPPSYFGVRPKGGKKEGGKKEGGKKGRSVWASHGGSDGGKGRQTSDRSDDGSRNPGGSEPSGSGHPGLVILEVEEVMDELLSTSPRMARSST